MSLVKWNFITDHEPYVNMARSVCYIALSSDNSKGSNADGRTQREAK